MKTSRRLKRPNLALGALLILLGAGCVQIEVRVKLNEDGSARVTERIRLTRQFLNLAGDRKDEFVKRLGRESAVERVKQMGKGVTLEKHEMRDADAYSKESFAEFRVEDINELRLVCPWFARPDYRDAGVIRMQLRPIYKTYYYGTGLAGDMEVILSNEKPDEAGGSRPQKSAVQPPDPTPLDLQVFRDLRPVLGDMVAGLRLRLTFECYAPIQSLLGVRGARGWAREMDLLDISDANLDNGGGSFYANEEAMLEVAQLQFDGFNVVEQVRGFGGNDTLPVFSPIGSPRMWHVVRNIWFKPSRALFDKHFAGKMLDPVRYPNTPPERMVPARFEEIGWQEPKTKTVE